MVEIDSLDNENGCTAGNHYFSEFFEVSKTRISLVIKSLAQKGFIKSKLVYAESSKQILYRVINICRPPYPTFVKEGIQQNEDTPIQQKLKDNNTSNNNTNNIFSYFENEDLNIVFNEYLKLRKRLKLSNEDRVIKRLTNTLSKFEDYIKIQMLEKAITCSWKDLYPLKDSEIIKELPKEQELVFKDNMIGE